MVHNNQSIINRLNMISDACLIFVAYYASLVLRFVFLDGWITLKLWAYPFSLIAGIYSIAIVFVYYVSRMYGSYRFKDVMTEALNILLINGIGIVFLMAVYYLMHATDFSRGVLVIYWLLSSFFVILKRLVGRAILRKFRKLNYSLKKVVIVGNGHLAFQYVNDIKNNPRGDVEILGYVSAVQKEGLGECLGSYEQLEDILSKIEADELIVALEPHEVQYMKNVIACADKEGIRLSLIPFFNDYFPANVRMNITGKTKLIDMRATPLDSIARSFIKRRMDIVGALVRIILTSPIMLITAVGVKLSSPGPVFFKQDRIGINKKPFKMLKFRSMKINNDEETGWSTDKDPRKTRFGSFIRKYSIDEFPQFFNVLLGHMSLVGPRPEVPYHVQRFKEDVPLYLIRQQIRPGITGWAQVNGLRGDTSIEDRVKYDIWYIENWSLSLDIKILFKTVFGGMKNNEEII